MRFCILHIAFDFLLDSRRTGERHGHGCFARVEVGPGMVGLVQCSGRGSGRSRGGWKGRGGFRLYRCWSEVDLGLAGGGLGLCCRGGVGCSRLRGVDSGRRVETNTVTWCPSEN